MSKLVIFLIILATALPVICYLTFSNQQGTEQDVTNIDMGIPDVRQDPKPGDSPQCAACRQIGDAGPQTECLQDFQCS